MHLPRITCDVNKGTFTVAASSKVLLYIKKCDIKYIERERATCMALQRLHGKLLISLNPHIIMRGEMIKEEE